MIQPSFVPPVGVKIPVESVVDTLRGGPIWAEPLLHRLVEIHATTLVEAQRSVVLAIRRGLVEITDHGVAVKSGHDSGEQ
jgi:hypothetical protein